MCKTSHSHVYGEFEPYTSEWLDQLPGGCKLLTTPVPFFEIDLTDSRVSIYRDIGGRGKVVPIKEMRIQNTMPIILQVLKLEIAFHVFEMNLNCHRLLTIQKVI